MSAGKESYSFFRRSDSRRWVGVGFGAAMFSQD